jgi:hypothetical protein
MVSSIVMNGPPHDRELATGSVDTTLIDEMLRLSPTERLRLNDRMSALATKLQEAFSGRQRRWLNRAS